MIEESIQYAKQAVELDVKDGASWCKFISLLILFYSLFFKDTLANSYVCFYFMVENHPKNLKQAFSAYNIAVRFCYLFKLLFIFLFNSLMIQHHKLTAIYIIVEAWYKQIFFKPCHRPLGKSMNLAKSVFSTIQIVVSSFAF
jgi:hypothetical protein